MHVDYRRSSDIHAGCYAFGQNERNRFQWINGNKCIHVVLQFVLSFQRNSPFDTECDHESICMRKSLQLVLIVHKWPKRWILRHRARDEMHISSHIVHTACLAWRFFSILTERIMSTARCETILFRLLDLQSHKSILVFILTWFVLECSTVRRHVFVMAVAAVHGRAHSYLRSHEQNQWINKNNKWCSRGECARAPCAATQFNRRKKAS